MCSANSLLESKVQWKIGEMRRIGMYNYERKPYEGMHLNGTFYHGGE